MRAKSTYNAATAFATSIFIPPVENVAPMDKDKGIHDHVSHARIFEPIWTVAALVEFTVFFKETFSCLAFGSQVALPFGVQRV